MLAAFAEAARVLDRADYASVAERNAEFIARELLRPDGRLFRSWRGGVAKLGAYLEDYASVAEGWLCLYETTFNPRWYSAARSLIDVVLSHFDDGQGGLYDTSDDHESLLFRPKSLQDNAVPSGNSLAATVLLKLASFSGEGRYLEAAEKLLGGVQELMARYPTGFGQWLVAMSYALSGAREIAILGKPDDERVRAFLDVIRRSFRPFQVTAVGLAGAPLPLLEGREQIGGLPTIYICQNFVCHMPLTDLEAFRAALG
jgi:uncharacterized protein YyaL (SSP411 family)